MHSMHHRLVSLAALAAFSPALIAQVPNDDCGGALVVVNGVNGPFTSVGATTSTPAWPCATGGNDVWFLYQAGAAGTLTADLCNLATYDSALEIFDGAGGCGGLVSLGCNDDTCNLQSSVTATLPSAGIYYIRVGGWNSSTGAFSLNVNGPAGGGGTTVLATNSALGQGCIRQFTSFYEYFPTAAGFDLANSSMSMLFTGGNYFVLPGTTTFVPPSANAAALTLGDDANTSVTLSAPFPYAGGTTTQLSVCSNGYVSVAAAGNGTAYTPNINAMLSAANTGWWVWHDLNPSLAGSGQVKFEEVGGIAYITWDGVYSFATTNPETFQLQFDLASGNVHFVFGAVGGVGNGYLVGYSPGGPSIDPGSRDISATLPLTFSTDPVDAQALALAASSRPVTGTNWNLTVSNVPATGLLGVDVFGLSDPGINDLFFLGAPGCGLRATLDVTNAWFVAGATHTYSLAIPSNPALLNFNLYTTSAVFQVPPVNALGAITSNGIQGMIGNL
jgi:hypothetical protein